MPIVAQTGAVWHEMTQGPNDLFLNFFQSLWIMNAKCSNAYKMQ